MDRCSETHLSAFNAFPRPGPSSTRPATSDASYNMRLFNSNLVLEHGLLCGWLSISQGLKLI
jgi:hypothetical protein